MKLESNPEAKTITFRGFVGDYDNGISADDFRAVLAEHEGQDVTIHLNSEGGSVTDGLSIFNAISQHDGEVTVHIDALAASIATVICCAADKVIMNSNAKFMIHRAWTVAMGNCVEFKKMANIMEMLDGDIADVYEGRTGIAKDELLSMMDEETWMTADEALASKFVDEVHDVSKARYDKKKDKDKDYAKAMLAPAMSRACIAAMNRRIKLRK